MVGSQRPPFALSLVTKQAETSNFISRLGKKRLLVSLAALLALGILGHMRVGLASHGLVSTLNIR